MPFVDWLVGLAALERRQNPSIPCPAATAEEPLDEPIAPEASETVCGGDERCVHHCVVGLEEALALPALTLTSVGHTCAGGDVTLKLSLNTFCGPRMSSHP